jgi:hypothetical protein
MGTVALDADSVEKDGKVRVTALRRAKKANRD